MCDEWIRSFDAFFECVGLAPSKTHSIDRIDVNGHYEPGNVRWATIKEQSINKVNTRYFTYNGKKDSVYNWCIFFGLRHETVSARIKSGWTVEKAITTPLLRQGKKSKPNETTYSESKGKRSNS